MNAHPSDSAGRGKALYVIAGLAGLIALTMSFAPVWDNVRQGLNDFPAFYVAPRMLATGDLYHPAAFLAKEKEVVGRTNKSIVFIRFPYVAVLLAPLSRLPFSVAYAVWQALSLAALGVFAWLWPARRPIACVICCWYPPVAANFSNAQDVAFLLLWLALAVWLADRDREFGAGLVLSLCAAKPHLFLFLPVVIIGRRMWKVSAGLAAGSAILLAVSFLAAGTGWPAEFLQAIRDPVVHPGIGKVSLVGFAGGIVQGPALGILVGVLILFLGTIVYRIARRRSFAMALAVGVAAGPVVAFHVYIQDYLLALPLVLILAGKAVERRPTVTVPSAHNISQHPGSHVLDR